MLPPASAGLLPGLAVGDTSRLTAEVEADFRTAGLTHLLAVSGANLAILSGAVLGAAACCCGPIRGWRRCSAWRRWSASWCWPARRRAWCGPR